MKNGHHTFAEPKEMSSDNLSKQWSKTQIYLICYHPVYDKEKLQIFTFKSLNQQTFGIFAWKLLKWLIDYQNGSISGQFYIFGPKYIHFNRITTITVW